MKLLKLLVAVALVTVSAYAKVEGEGKLCDEQHCADLNDKSCKCWCSVKCGPRQKGVGNNGIVDSPRWNKEHKKCFCQDRDEEMYVANCLNENKE